MTKRGMLDFIEMQRFAVVGIIAAITHYVAGLVYVQYLTPSVVIANVMAYFTALIISVLGHSHFSFNVRLSWHRLFKFFVVSISAMGISTITVYVVHMILPRVSVALLVGIIVSAGYTFVLSKTFAFK